MEIISKYNLLAKKKFGQNFLTDENVLRKIVDFARDIENKNILEIGPGPGGLTSSILAKKPKKLVSVEIDRELYEIIKKEFKYPNFDIINKDAMLINEKGIFNNEMIGVVANLPYNIGTNLLMKWFRDISIFSFFTLLLQKEVVDRIAAKPFTKEYGRLSVISQLLCNVKKGFDLKAHLFYPKPKVTSTVVSLIPKHNVNIDLEKLSFITFTFFNQRRKKIRKVVESLIFKKKLNESIVEILDLNKRAEEITIEEYSKITHLCE